MHYSRDASARAIANIGRCRTQDGRARREGETFAIEANTDSNVLLLSGEPIDEPVVGSGPFGMNTKAEIVHVVEGFNKGCFGRIAR